MEKSSILEAIGARSFSSSSPTRSIRVLALVPDVFDVSPGQRYRIEQWAGYLGATVEITYAPFLRLEDRALLSSGGNYFRKTWRLISAFGKRWSELKSAAHFDVVYVYREIAVIGPPILESYLAHLKVPVVFDFDDAIFLRYASTTNGWFSLLKFPRAKTRALCRMAANVMVGNEYLASYVRQFNSNVKVIPTTMDLARYTVVGTKNNATPVIGWTGSYSTAQYLQTIRGALEQVSNSEAFRFRLIGSFGQRFELSNAPVEIIPWRSETEVDDLRTLSIGLMPLADDPWSRGKCACKALQYMALGIPVVCSPVGVVPELIKDGRNGFLAESQEQWVEKLLALLRSPELRKQIGQNGRKVVEERYSGEAWAKVVGQILRSAVIGLPAAPDCVSQGVPTACR